MEGRRVRRFGRARRQDQTLLPLRRTRLSNTVSCWYCDFKSTVLNDPLFRFGRKYSRFLQVWFSVGTGFSLAALLGVVMILLWELGRMLHLYHGNFQLGSLYSGTLFWFSSAEIRNTDMRSLIYHRDMVWVYQRLEILDCQLLFVSVLGVYVGLLDILFVFSLHVLMPIMTSARLLVQSALCRMLDTFVYPQLCLCLCMRLGMLWLLQGTIYALFSEGIQMEYIAVFCVVVFPGALVAFNQELLQTLSRAAALRVYCAGIWHNAVACFICALALFLLPVMLDPFYIYGDCPMVLNVSPTSPLSTYLSPHDLVISLSGLRIHSVQEWKEAIAILNEHKLSKFQNSSDFTASGTHIDKIGYCVPQYLIKGSMATQQEGNRASCSDELYAFSAIPCFQLYTLKEVNGKNDFPVSIHCFNPEDVIKLKRCGHSQVDDLISSASCPCSEDESCFAPVQKPLQAWVEITYLSAQGCPQAAKDSFPEVKSADYRDINCSQSFVFVGDVISLERSLQLTSYRPRWPNVISTRLPNVMEKLLICTFHVSLALALFNSLPVYFLDGECILEMMLQYLGLTVLKTREKVLRWLLLSGSLVSLLVFTRSVTFF